MANIEHVNVNGVTYDVRVPNGSSLSLSSLNVTGTITGASLNLGSGTLTAGIANLTTIKINGEEQTLYKMTLSGEILYIESV